MRAKLFSENKRSFVFILVIVILIKSCHFFHKIISPAADLSEIDWNTCARIHIFCCWCSPYFNSIYQQILGTVVLSNSLTLQLCDYKKRTLLF